MAASFHRPFRPTRVSGRSLFLALGLSWLILGTGFFAAPAHAQPQPGDVYREYVYVISSGQWRVTDPNVQRPDARRFLPNPTFNIPIDDLQGAVRAEVTVDRWGGHPGTKDKRLRFNGNAWIDLPEPGTIPSSKPECYMYQDNVTVEVPLGDLRQGTNTIQGTAGKDGGYTQSCFNFNWPQWGWYGVIVRIYYNPAQKAEPSGTIVSPAAGSSISDNPTIAATASGNGGISRVDFVAYYDGYDTDGDGVYRQWQGSYHRDKRESALPLRNHVGTATSASGGQYSVMWDTEWVPDQAASSVKVAARIRDGQGLWYMTEAVEGLTLARSGYSVQLYKAQGVPQRFWVRSNRAEMSSQVTIPSGNLNQAEEAILHVATWNGIDGQGVRVNGSSYRKLGEDHHYSYEILPVSLGNLNHGTNQITFRSTSSHHGIEIMWPGPAVAVKSGSAPPSNTPPTAVATGTPTSGEAPLTVSFDGSGSSDSDGTITSYAWTFGDGGTGTGATPSHTYAAPGTYTATLTVTDNDGATGTATVTITATGNDPPTAVAAATPTSGDAPLTVSFDGSSSSDSDGTITGYAWTFGDGGTGTGATPSHTYQTPGTYTATLTVTDDDGATGTATVSIVAIDPNAEGRVAAGLQVLYTFTEGTGTTVTDVSGTGTPLDLTIGTPSGATWVPGGGLTLTGPADVASAGPATTLSQAIRTSGALTLEAWIAPANTTQDGPARIVTLSGSATARNVTLGQGRWGSQPKTVYDVRLRTSATDANGRPSVTSPTGSAAVQLQHVVYTRSSGGAARIYVDGVEVESATVGGNLSGWSTQYALRLGNETDGDRRWSGTYRLVAFYDRALVPAEVAQNYAAGPAAGGDPPNDPPTAVATATPTSGDAPLTVSFDGSSSSDSDGTITGYAWTFGDGGTGTGATPSHTYQTPGTYTATLTVTDDDGATGTATVSIVAIDPNAEGRVAAGLQVLYTFTEGTGTTVTDVSGTGTPLDLTIGTPSGATWVPGGGLTLTGPADVASAGPATTLSQAIRTSGALTLEAWIAPANTTQDGPARIVTLSGSATARNVTLGQGRWGSQPKTVYDVRLRTSATDANGRPSVTSPTGSAAVQLQHVVYTRSSGGAARIYVDGVEVESATVGGNLSGWSTQYALRLGNETDGDRLWRGTYHLVALYDQALTAAEVDQNYQAGTPAGPSASVAEASGRVDVLTDASSGANDGVAAAGTDAGDPAGRITAFELHDPYPNPSAGRAVLTYAMPRTEEVRVEVYDLLGKRVAVLAEGVREAGLHRATFDGAGLPSGLYVCRFQAGGVQQTRTLLLLR